MTRGGRALLGAALGAALTLALHPASRPYVFSSFISPRLRAAPSPKPTSTLIDLAAWMTALGDQYQNRIRLTPLELRNALEVATLGAKRDPRNAFWRQMLAWIYHAQGDENRAREEWSAAAALDTWNDYQSSQLFKERDRIADAFGAAQSWQLADVYYQRTDSAVALISSYSRYILVTSSLDTKEGLLMRTNNVLNGALLRLGSRSIRIGEIGAKMSESACQPPKMVFQERQHKLFLQRIGMQNQLRENGHPDLADQVHKIYNETDAWGAFESADDAQSFAAECSYLSLLLVGLPSVLLVMGSLGLIVWLIGYGMRKVERIAIVPAAVAGIALGLGAYGITRLPLAAATTFLCCLFLTLGPKRERSGKIDDLGPMFSFTTGAIGLVFLLMFGAFIIGAGAPAVSVLPELGEEVPSEYFGGSGVLLGLAVIVLAILLLVAPLFATALRVGTSYVLSLALRKFGAFLFYLSLASLVVGTPLCIYLDRDNASALSRLVANEPVYYLTLSR